MAREAEDAAGSAPARQKGRKQPVVICSAGTSQRFLRGMITHDLVQRGVDFDDAYAVARSIRARLTGRDEVSTSEIRDLIAEELEELLGADWSDKLASPPSDSADLTVTSYQGRRQPFSRGVLARSIQAAGLNLDHAYRVVVELRAQLAAEGIEEIESGELARRVGELLEEQEGRGAAARYRLVRRIHRLPRPLVIYIGGASGTGKSTLSLELAPLLRIYRISATDTIRQVMRMMFSQQVLPALHSSSFEVAPAFGAGGEEWTGAAVDPTSPRLIETFEEQAARVCVGVRAVVERAIAENMSIVVEGVHLSPPWVPFSDLEGAVYQVPLVLATQDVEEHRARFVTRARGGGRRADRYLENFTAIRTVHDYILEQAEAHDTSLIETSYGGPVVARAVRVVTSLLQKRLPNLIASDESVEPSAPTLLLIVDGMADRPVRALGGRTPLQAAATPTLDRLASEGQTGLADAVSKGVVPDTAAGTLALLGQSPLAMKRGPVEAVGAGLSLRDGDVALRANFATLNETGQVIDRRAGRIREDGEELAAALDWMTLPGELAHEVQVRVRVSTEHRLAIILRGEGLSSAVQGSDPGEGAIPCQPLVPEPVDPADQRAVYTARVLAVFEEEAKKILERHPVNRRRVAEGLMPANVILSRGLGRLHRLVPLEQAGLPLQVTCIAGDRTILGLAKWLGARTSTAAGMTANLDTDLKAKFDAAAEALRKRDLVIVHLKGADIAAHDQRPDLKAAFLEQVDHQLGRLLDSFEGPVRVAVGSDHATLSESGQHAADPLPCLIWGEGIDADDVETFDEQSVAAGKLGRFPLQLLLGRLFDLS